VGGETQERAGTGFLDKWPTLEDLKRARPATVEKFYLSTDEEQEKLQGRLAGIGAAKHLTRDRAVVRASTMKLRVTVEQLRVLLKATRDSMCNRRVVPTAP